MLAEVKSIRGEQETIGAYIEGFYNEYRLNSELTARSYTRDIEKFLEFATEMKTDFPADNISTLINYQKVVEFRQHEVKRKLKATSINRNITALKEFGKYLRARGIEVHTSFFDSIKNLKGDGDKYEVLTIQEGIQIAEWLRDNEKNKATMKYYYTLLAIDTGIRADALAKLTPSNFIEKDDVVMIKGVDKGKKSFSKPVSKQLYHEMKSHFKEWNATKQPVFTVTAKNRTDMIQRAVKGLGWENRNIVFHSLKKAAVNNAFETTGDIMVAMKVGGHSSVTTTQTYLADGDDFMGAISNGARKVEDVNLEDFSKEELIEAMQQLSVNSQYQLKVNLMNSVN